MCKTNRCGKSTLLNKQQLELLTVNLPQKYSLLAELLYFTAGRVSEITSLKVRNINTNDAMLTIEKASTKTKETRDKWTTSLELACHWYACSTIGCQRMDSPCATQRNRGISPTDISNGQVKVIAPASTAGITTTTHLSCVSL